MLSDEFHALAARGYNRIPVSLDILADADTALGAYLKLANAPYSYLFESLQGGETWGRYSIIGLPCPTVICVRGQDITVETGGVVREAARTADPLAWLECYAARHRVPELPGLPRFTGGLVGYFGYDAVRYVEPRLARQGVSDPLGVPDILLMVSDEVLVFDNLRGRLQAIVHADPGQPQAWEQAQDRLQALARQLRDTRLPEPGQAPRRAVQETDFVPGFSKEAFESAVARVKDYIAEGDVMQVVLSQRMTTPLAAPPIDLYRALRGLNPSPHMFHMDLGGFQVVGSSPEILVRVEDENVTVRPIAGTRRRGRTDDEDRALEQDLLGDPKELAEHLMLVDLGRNDVGRVSQTGSVRVTQRMVIERYSHVMHIVSNVTGRIRPDTSAMDTLRATFPAGTVSGAPKVRAMEIIDELEPVKRGVYAGAVGYLSWSGTLDTAIAIRTAVVKDGLLHIQAGAGIVADSVPELEWEETLNKGRAMFKAVAIAEAGLQAAHHHTAPSRTH